jgi:hypothetical protein
MKMESKNVLKQKFRYAVINPYKDYSNVNKPTSRIITEKNSDDSDFVPYSFLKETGSNQLVRHMKFFTKESRKNKKYFYLEEPIKFSTDPYSANDFLPFEAYNKHEYYTTKDRHIKRHFGRPFTTISIIQVERTIIVSEDKITVYSSEFTKTRQFNCKFFRKRTKKTGFSINLINGDFITWNNSVVRKNVFATFHTSSLGLFYLEKTMRDKKCNQEFKNEFINTINDNEFNYCLKNVLEEKFGISTVSFFSPNEIFDLITKFFIKQKNIKIPDNYKNLLYNWYPTKKYLKKNDNKLVAAVLDRLNIKSKSMVKIFHDNPNIDIVVLIRLIKLFGVDQYQKYFSLLSPDFFRNLIQDKINIGGHGYISLQIEYLGEIKTTHEDRIRIVKLLNCIKTLNERNYITDTNNIGVELNTVINDIKDHLRMLEKIKDLFPDSEFKANNWKEFHEEHREFSKKENIVNRGYTINLSYDGKFVDYIENKIEVKDKIYYPVLLKSDHEYSLEGSHMKHCVGGYVEKQTSIIVSLREGNRYGHDRVTSEFNINTKECLQSRFFCNQKPPEHFEEPLSILYNRVKKYKDTMSATLVKEKIDFENLKEIFPEITHF